MIDFICSCCDPVLDDAFGGSLERLRRKPDARVVRLSPLPPEHPTVSRAGSTPQGPSLSVPP